MDTLQLKYNFELPKEFFKDVNPKIRSVLNTYIHNVVYEQTDKYYIVEHDSKNNTKNIYYIDDFNSKEIYYLLYESLRNCRYELVCELLNIYRDVNISDNNNLLLNMACHRAQHPIISKLISAGIDVTANNNTAIKLVSLLFGDYYIDRSDVIMTLEILLNNGADLHVDNDFVLCYASHDILAFRYLLQLDHKYDITTRNNYCLLKCVHSYFNNIICQYDKLEGEEFSKIVKRKEKILIDININEFVVSDIIKILLNMGTNVNCNNGYIINDVVMYGDKYLIKLFIEHGADLNLVTNNSLIHIIKSLNNNTIKLLIDNGVNISKINYEPIKNLQKIEMGNLLLEMGLSYQKVLDLI
nr:putative ankyrin repeat protein [Megavirus caiporensis]